MPGLVDGAGTEGIVKHKLNRDDVVRRLTALGVQPAQQRYVLQKLELELPVYGDGGRVVDPTLVGGAEDWPLPGNLYPAEPQPPVESVFTRRTHIPLYFLKYLFGTDGNPSSIPISNLDTTNVKLSKFPRIRAILDAGKPGTHNIVATHSFETDFPESYYVGYVNHNLVGQLTIDKSGRYSFTGTHSAGPDLYNMNPSTHRTDTAETATTVGRTLGSTIHDNPFPVYITGTKPFAESGQLPLPPDSP